MPHRILRFPEVKAASGLSRSTIYLRISNGLFPPPIALGPRMVGWPQSEIEAVNAARIRGASDNELRSLIASLKEARKDAA